MAKSQNGWSAGTPAQIGGLDTSAVPGTNVKLPQGVRKGDVATVLHYVAQQFHLHVEPLHAGWCWGYDYKQIEGGTSLSNHASGTAIDLNAETHPMGKRGTFSTAKKTAIHAILAHCDGVVRWGGDYTGRPDEMHFEIVKSATDVARLAAKLRGTSTPVTPPATTGLTVDGLLGAATIRRWQQVMHTPVDGKISNPSDLIKAVQRALNSHGAKPVLLVDGKGIAQDGTVTHTIRALQSYLHTPVDGKLSKPSDCVKALQRRLNTGTF